MATRDELLDAVSLRYRSATRIEKGRWRAVPVGSGYHGLMPFAARIDLSALPEDQRDAVAALLSETASLKEIVRRLEHLVAELNHVVHGKKSEKCQSASKSGPDFGNGSVAVKRF